MCYTESPNNSECGMDHESAYLRLSPELESIDSDHMNEEIRIGSDQQNCAICIAPALPIHAKINIQGNHIISIGTQPKYFCGDEILDPKNYGSDGHKHWRCLSIVVEQGPKFIIELDELLKRSRFNAKKKLHARVQVDGV